jgi:hypothetical protein
MKRDLFRHPKGVLRSLAVWLVVTGSPQLARAEPGHPALRKLVPLLEVFAAGKPVPGYDVAGLRCAGLLLAQYDWAERHPGVSSPSRDEMRQADLMLEASEQQRLNDGLDLVQAHVTVEREARRVWQLYQRQFARNDRQGRHPWQDDPLILGDSRFCAALSGRN